MTRLLPLLLLLFACGPSMRGPLVRPPPVPVLRPGHGLPSYDPANPQAKPERSPHKRVLPPQRGPGIWAGDDTDGVTDVDPKEFTILGVILPLPPEMYEGKTGDAGPAIECAKHWKKVLSTDAAKWIHDIKDDAVRRCLVAFMNESCATLPDAVHDHIMKPGGVISLDVRQHAPEMVRRAEAFTDLMCKDARTIGFYIDRFKKLVPDYYEAAFRDALERVK